MQGCESVTAAQEGLEVKNTESVNAQVTNEPAFGRVTAEQPVELALSEPVSF